MRSPAFAAVAYPVLATFAQNLRVLARHVSALDLQIAAGAPADAEERFVDGHDAAALNSALFD